MARPVQKNCRIWEYGRHHAELWNSLLESECLRVINSVGLDAHVGFLHEMNPSKNSLAYDLQEPFRFLVDLAVIKLVESGVGKKRFHKNRKL